MLSQLKSFSKFGVICGSGKEPLRIAKLLSEVVIQFLLLGYLVRQMQLF